MRPNTRIRRPHVPIGLIVLATALTAAVGAGCRSTTLVDAGGNEIRPGGRAFTLANIHVRKNVGTSVNRQYPEMVKVCTEVEVFELGRKRMGFRLPGRPGDYYFKYHKVAGEPFGQNLARYFGTRCPQDQIARMSRIDQYGIEQGRPFIGMTRQGITIAMGPPPKRRTPNFSDYSWLYWAGRRGYLTVKFDPSGHLHSVEGLEIAAITPPRSIVGPAMAQQQQQQRQPGYYPQQGSRNYPQNNQRAMNNDRRGNQRPPQPPRQLDAGDGKLYSKRVAVVIGINDYTYWPNLSGASGDGQRMARYLRESGWDEVIELYDKDATRRNMLKMLGSQLPQLTDENTLAMIYFAGHGQTETLPDGQKRGYLVPVDGDTSDVFSTAISMQTVKDLSKRTSAKHVYYALDACYSGMALTRGIAAPGTSRSYLQKITSVPVVQVITAGGEGEQALEMGGQGLFTTYLLRGIQGEADANSDGAVTASEIGAFVKPHVTNASRSQQTPQFGTMEGAGEVVFLVER